MKIRSAPDGGGVEVGALTLTKGASTTLYAAAYSDAACTGGNEITQASISMGSAITSFYFSDATVGTPTISTGMSRSRTMVRITCNC